LSCYLGGFTAWRCRRADEEGRRADRRRFVRPLSCDLDASPIAGYRKPMVERLVIARLGSRGDGIADTAAGALYVPYALPGETAEVEPWPGHADRRHLLKVDVASPDRIAP